MPKRSLPVHRLRVLAPVQRLRRRPDTDAREVLYKNFCMVGQTPPVNPLHHLAPLAAYGAEGARVERGDGGREEYTKKEEEGRREVGRGDNIDWTSGNSSNGRSTSSTRDYESSIEGTDRTLGAAEDQEVRHKVTRRHGIQGDVRRGGRGVGQTVKRRQRQH